MSPARDPEETRETQAGEPDQRADGRGEPRLSRVEELRRASRTTLAVAKIYLGYKGLSLLDRGALRTAVRSARRRWHRSSATTLYDTALDLGGLFLKAGQYLSTRADLLPAAFGERLERLQDRVPPHPHRVVRRVIEQELGAPPNEVFKHFWRRPIASASLAQVHRAVLDDGRHVAVKVQRPEAAARVHADLRNLRRALQTIERLEGKIGITGLLDEMGHAVPRELDFELEAANARRLRRCLAGMPGVRIPEPIEALTTRRVLVTDFVSGIKVTDVRRLSRAGIDRAAVAHALVEVYGAQILRHGVFHADPHPGNLIVVPRDGGFDLALVDFGLIHEVPAGFQEQVAALAGDLLRQDSEGVANALAGLGLLGTRAAPAASTTLQKVAERMLEFVRLQTAPEGDADDSRERLRGIGRELTDLLRDDPNLEIPPYFWGVGRVVGLISGISALLGVRLDLVRGLLPLLAPPK